MLHRAHRIILYSSPWAVLLAAVIGVLLLIASPGDVQAASLPKWVKVAISRKLPVYSRQVPYAVLLDETSTTVKKTGKAETKYRYVIELLTSEGRSAARKDIYYDRETTVSNVDAWHIRAGGGVEKLEREGIQEQSMSDDLYSDSRTRIVRFNDADVGSIIAFEWTQEQRPFINQQYHFFQERAPVLLSIYRLKLPPDWRVDAVVYNHDPVEPVVQDSTRAWQLSYLPPIEREPMMPAITSVAPYVAVSYFPPSQGRAAQKSFESWKEVSRWAAQLMDSEAVPDETIERKAQGLTQGLSTTQERIKALSTWVQKEIRYVSIQLGSKGGYRPHPASLVLKKGYGDCKDKACLLEAMLASIGVKSYITLVYSGDPTRVRPDFPSVLQFNHAILAIDTAATPPGADGADLHDVRGGLVFFDPSDNATSPGGLPYYLQGSYALVVRGDSGELVQLPTAGEETNTLSREASLALDLGGTLAGSIREKLTGQIAARQSDLAESPGSEGFGPDVAAEITRSVPGADVKPVPADPGSKGGGATDSAYYIRAPGFASVSGKIMVVKPLGLWSWRFPPFDETSRSEPVVFGMKSAQEDTVSIRFPPGMRIDEYPRNAVFETGFGKFSLIYDVGDREITVHRRLVISQLAVKPSDYRALSRFFADAQRASDAGIVLLKN